MWSDSRPRRVVLLIADDWSPLAGCYGHRFPETPHIDALATEGTVFHRAYCTTPSCGPSRACILTGHHSYTHGQYGNPHGPSAFRVDSRIRPLTRYVKDAGVRTGIIGKRHLLPLEPFEFDFVSANEKIISKDRTIADLAAFFELAGQNPFFLTMAPYLPHRTSPEGFDHANYRDLPLRQYSPDEVDVPEFLPDLPGVRLDLANYYTAITRFDTWVGLVLDEFKQRNLYEGTLFLVMSDHGMPFLGAKATPFEGGHRCPLIAACPGSNQEAARHTDALVSWLDIAPTVTEWLGAEAAPDWTGHSLLNQIREQEAEPEERVEVYLSHMFHGLLEYYPYRIVCRKRWKYILRVEPGLSLPVPSDLIVSRSFREIMDLKPEKLGSRSPQDVFYGPAEALYDLENDPSESNNLADDPACADVLTELRASMESHRVKTRDPLLGKKNQAAWQSVYPAEN